MAAINSIKLPNGTTYTLTDSGALQLTGGNVTGPVTFGDTISIDDATIGTLVVTGGASFVNTISGSVTGSSGSSKPILLSNENLNDIHPDETTWYYAGGSHSITNGPSDLGTSGFGMVAFRTASGYREQIIITYNDKKYSRYYNGSSWTSWVEWKLTDTNTWTALVGATSSANGSVGYINATPPKDGYNTKYFRADGSWAVPTNTTYSAGTGLSLSSTTFSLATSGATAGSYGPSADASPAHGGTFSVPYVTVDTYGRVTGIATKTITLPASGNTDTKVSITNTNPDSQTAYYPTWHTATSGTGVTLNANNGFIYRTRKGIANTEGQAIIELGNSTATTAADNRKGYVRLYSGGTKYGVLSQADITEGNASHILPATGGTILNTGTTSFTQSLTSGTTVGTIKINGTSTTLYAPTNTDHRRIFYGTCSTAAATVAKTVTLSSTTGWELVAGTVVGVKYTNTNTAESPTININSSGAKSVWYSTAQVTTSNLNKAGLANRIIYYMYDGTYWVFMSWSLDDNTTYSAMSQSEANTGTATTARSITAKVLNDKITNYLTPVEIPLSLTATTGTFVSADSYCYRSGNVVQMVIMFKKTSSTSAGNNCFEATLGSSVPKPICMVKGSGFYSKYTIVGQITTSGTVTFRNATTSSWSHSSSDTGTTVGFTYITND